MKDGHERSIVFIYLWTNRRKKTDQIDKDTAALVFGVRKFIRLYIEIVYIYPTPPLRQDLTQGQFFKRSLTGLNSEFFLLLD